MTKKIFFSDKYGLTNAVLQGRKTMTRRTVQGKYLRIYEDMSRLGQPCYPLEEWLIRKAAAYKVGEIVAVAQRYSELSWDERFYEHLCSMCELLPQYELKGWNNKMFVRADLMPHQIRITNIKVERLQDISEEDCMREGIVKGNLWKPYNYTAEGLSYFEDAIEAFATLIDKVSGKGTWERNPYVFAYSFKLIQ